jgi:hypothetical protein
MKDNSSTPDGHASHVAGTMIASGVNPLVKGMANGIQGMIAYNFTGHLGEMLTESPNLYISNHSYGTIAGWRYNSDQSRWEWYGQPDQVEDNKFGYYSTETQTWDSIAYMSPNYLIVKSSGNNRNEKGPDVGGSYWRYNAAGTMVSAGARPAEISNQDGYDLLPTYSTSKNILTVGNVLAIPGGYVKPGDVVLNNSSSVGPTDDGRIKPDIVANGTNVTSTYTGSDNAYATLSGTSMSSPTVSGSAILLQELYMRLNGNSPAWSSTIRGLVIHSADEAGNSPGPDYLFGWGLANFYRAAMTLNKPTENLVQQRTLSNGTTYSMTVTASGKSPLKASICWTDPPGEVNTTLPINDRTKKLVHDLDIRIKRGGRTYFPWKLDVANPSFVASRDDNNVDNVEVVQLDSTITGETYTIEVTHKGTLTRSGTQAYSLIVSGIGGKAYASSAPAESAGSRIDSLSFGGINKQNTSGCKTYTDFRSIIGTVEVGVSAPFFMKVNSCDATDAVKFAKVFLDLNNDGDFDDAGETGAVSGSLANNGTFSGNITIPNTLVPGTLIMMRVVLQETASASNVNPTGTYTRGETQDYLVRITNPSNDLSPSQVVYPQSGECANNSKYVTVKIRNLGTLARTQIPVTVEVLKGTSLVTTLKDTCKVAIAGQSDADFTLQKPFVMEGGTSYSFNIKVNSDGDQLPANNEAVSQIVTSSQGTAPTGGIGVICNNTTALLKANVTGTDSKLTWFTVPTGGSPFNTSSNGEQISTTTITADKKYYVSANEISGTVGPATKMAFPSGGYNEFNGNFVRFSNTVPMLIESTRMYVGNPGKITIILADIASETGTGGYSYYPLSTRVFTVTNTRPTAAPGSVSENNAADLGSIFNLNFTVPAGNHILIMQCTDGATVYRNNNIATNPYPLLLNGNNNAFSITGNSVVAPSDPNQFYYFFYDTKVSTLAGCPSPRATITANSNTPPVISYKDTVLTSTLGTGNQWQLNGVDIAGATGQTYKVKESGVYRSAVTGDLGCVGYSNEINVVITAVVNVDPVKIGLNVSPNPSTGNFNVRFRVNGREDLYVEVLSTTGQQVYSRSLSRFSGEFNEQLRLPNPASGIYLLKITHGREQYLKRLLIN